MRRWIVADLIGEAIAAAWIATRETAARIADWVGTALFGPRCRYDCGQRIYPRDRAAHEGWDHAGDEVTP